MWTYHGALLIATKSWPHLQNSAPQILVSASQRLQRLQNRSHIDPSTTWFHQIWGNPIWTWDQNKVDQYWNSETHGNIRMGHEIWGGKHTHHQAWWRDSKDPTANITMSCVKAVPVGPLHGRCRWAHRHFQSKVKVKGINPTWWWRKRTIRWSLVVDVVVSTSNYSTYPTFFVDLYSNSPREESIVDFYIQSQTPCSQLLHQLESLKLLSELVDIRPHQHFKLHRLALGCQIKARCKQHPVKNQTALSTICHKHW